MPRCLGSKPDGTPCERIVGASQDYCYSHDPDRSDERRRAASKGGKRGGKGRPQVDLATLKDRLITLGDDVLDGRVDRGDAAVAGQLWNIAIAAIRTGLKAREVEELEERLEELEAILARREREGA